MSPLVQLVFLLAFLAGVTLLVAWWAALEARRAERKDARLRALHPSQSRASVIDQPPGEHVRRIPSVPPYDWQQQGGDADGGS